MLKKIAVGTLSLGLLTACHSVHIPSAPSASTTNPKTLNQSQRTQACTVVSSRQVALTSPYTGNNNTRTAAGQQERTGQILGVIAGALIGQELNDKNGALIGAALGGLAGANIGNNQDRQSPASFGTQYVVQTERGYVTVTQGQSPDDHFLIKGSPCFVTGSGRNVRVIYR